MADYKGQCVMLTLGLLLLGFTVVQPAALSVKTPPGCAILLIGGPYPNLVLNCKLTSANINVILYEMKQPSYAIITLQIRFEFLHFQFGEEAFNPNLQFLEIYGDNFSISPGTLIGLRNLIKLTFESFEGVNSTTDDLNINNTSPVFRAGWLSPLINLKEVYIYNSNISSFSAETFCTLNQLKYLQLNNSRLISMDGLGMTCSSSTCPPCLPNVTHLNIAHNPISDITVNISMNLPSLTSLNTSHCNLSVLNFNSATPESIEHIDVSHNKLNSLLVDEEAPCIRPHLQRLQLENNQIETVSPGFFLCMPHLQFLNLSRNAVTDETLISAGLNNLMRLKWLDLSYNNINILEPDLIGNITELLQFWCTGCGLTIIDHGTFIRITNLTYLALDNNNLTMIEARHFSHLTGLHELYLFGNFLHEITFTKDLISLRVLDLSDNLISDISFFIYWWPNLTSLTMDKNQITHIGRLQISSLTDLTHLSLAFNNIERITDQAFLYQDFLETLVLSSNRIETISEFGFDRFSRLTHLSLDHNFLTKLPPLKFPTLTFLNLSRNLIKTVDVTFVTSLRGIDLSHNHISQIKSDTSVFKHLQYANYSFNQLSTLDPNQFTTNTLPRPKVYLQGNPLHVDCNSDWLLDTKLDNIVSQDKWKGNDLSKKNWTTYSSGLYYVEIADLDLLQCTFDSGERKSFPKISKKEFVCEYAQLCVIADCIQNCCADFSSCICTTSCYPECTCYYTQDDSIHLMNCSSRNMTSLPSDGPSYVRSIALDGNNLSSINSSYLNFPYLIKLNASNSHISYVQPGAFSNMTMVRILNLEQNSIEKISKQTFALLFSLENLHLQGNKIHQIDSGSFDDLVRLKVLWLHGNNLKTLHFSLFERIDSLRELTLYDNPWSCDCQSGPAFKEWLTYSEIIVNHSLIYCNNEVPSDMVYNTRYDSYQYNMTNKTLSQHYQAVLDMDFTSCTNRSIIERVYNHTITEIVHHHSKSITEVVSLAAVVVVLAIFILVIYKTRLLLRVWFYNKFGVRFHEEEDDNDDKPYDLFIAYAKVDERLVLHELLPKLEGGGMSYKVCLECRDWHPGTTTTDAVVASVQLSKRTIVLVSPNHLDTQWCEYSFDAAHYQVLKDKQIRLILVLTDLELEARMTRAMKLYMKTNTFLVIGEKWFWKKLRYYLADNPRGADHVVGREFRLMNAY